MTIDEMISVLESAKQGKVIQHKDAFNDWRNCNPSVPSEFMFYGSNEYRVAPEPPERCPKCGRRIADILASGGTIEHDPEPRKPREFWLTTDPSYSPIQEYPFPNSIHVREVIE